MSCSTEDDPCPCCLPYVPMLQNLPVIIIFRMISRVSINKSLIFLSWLVLGCPGGADAMIADEDCAVFTVLQVCGREKFT